MLILIHRTSLAVHLGAHGSGFKLIVEGHELVNQDKDVALVFKIQSVKFKSPRILNLHLCDILNAFNDFVRINWCWNLRRFMHKIKICDNNSFKSFFKVTYLI